MVTSTDIEERNSALRLSNLSTFENPYLPLPVVRLSPLLEKLLAKEPESSEALATLVGRLLLRADISYLWVFRSICGLRDNKHSTFQIEFFEAFHISLARNYLPPSRVRHMAWSF